MLYHRPYPIVLALCALIAISCTSSKKLLEQRRYDGAIAKSVEKLARNPRDADEISVLSQAYAMANQEDTARIKFLKQSGEPQVWDEVYARYLSLKRRQNLVNSLRASVRQRIDFEPVDYDGDILDAKRKAADYHFAEGAKFLARNNRYDARAAYGHFSQAEDLLPSYAGLSDSLDKAFAMGQSHVLYSMKNRSGSSLPHTVIQDLARIGFNDGDQGWVVFDTRRDPHTHYDHAVTLTISDVSISPELSGSHEAVETKEVDDGWEQVLDANGVAMTDSLGNPLRTKKTRTLKCYVTRISLGKSATLSGTVEFVDAQSGQLQKSEPVSAEQKFSFVYAKVRGDTDALSDETRQLTRLKLAPFPSNTDLLSQAAARLKETTRSIVLTNASLLE